MAFIESVIWVVIPTLPCSQHPLGMDFGPTELNGSPSHLWPTNFIGIRPFPPISAARPVLASAAVGV